MGVWLGPYGGRITENSFVFKKPNGDPGAYEFAADENGHWELALLESGTLTWRKLKTAVDVFVVGGGKNGYKGAGYLNSSSDSQAYGGNGGNGGGTATQRGLTLATGQEYPVIVGTAEKSSSAFGVTATSGTGSNGGAGAQHGYGLSRYGDARVAAGNGSPGVLAFGTADTLLKPGYKYGAGGGGGSAYSTLGGNLAAAGAGGATGGGNGGSDATGSSNNGYGEAGAANCGAGGGGGSSYMWNSDDVSTYHTRSGGAGGSGIIIIRNHRPS